jgi:hypothetical protein
VSKAQIADPLQTAVPAVIPMMDFLMIFHFNSGVFERNEERIDLVPFM